MESFYLQVSYIIKNELIFGSNICLRHKQELLHININMSIYSRERWSLTQIPNFYSWNVSKLRFKIVTDALIHIIKALYSWEWPANCIIFYRKSLLWILAKQSLNSQIASRYITFRSIKRVGCSHNCLVTLLKHR